jgi:hypothetical protein
MRSVDCYFIERRGAVDFRKIFRRLDTAAEFRQIPYLLQSEVTNKLPEAILQNIVRNEFIYALAGLVVGVLCILGGFILVILGVSGSIEWVVKGGTFESQLKNAGPGALLCILGFLLVGVTRYRLRVGELAATPQPDRGDQKGNK